MQGVEQAPALHRTGQQRTRLLAWLVLLVSFCLFCALIVAAGYTTWHYQTYATIEPPGTALINRTTGLVGAEEWVVWKPKGRTIFQQARSAEALSEGDEVRISNTAGYGQIATIRLFDQSTLDLWPGADIVLEQLRVSRWNQREQQVVLRHIGGYVRYDLRNDQPFQQVTYTVHVGSAKVVLAPGGSYSIAVMPPERRVVMADSSLPTPIVSDIAVRTGIAYVYGADGREVRLLAGLRVEVDPAGVPGLPVPARWELIRDGNFDEYDEQVYNNTTIPLSEQPTLPRARTWEVFGEPLDTDVPGVFKLFQVCRPPRTTQDCDSREWRNAAGFIRTGNQTRPFRTGIRQYLGVNEQGIDISEYRSLVFSAWVRVLHQSIPLAGIQGSECPMMVRFFAKRNSPTDPEHQRVLCIYYADPNTSAQLFVWPGVQYIPVNGTGWYPVKIELRDQEWLQDYYYLSRIEIYANGHDYDSRVTDISLIGSQYTPIPGR